MITVRQIERSWSAKQHDRLLRDLLAARPEGAPALQLETGGRAAAAAMGVIRLDELSQSHRSLYPELIQAICAAQQADGGWGDPASTALCLRALLCGQGHGSTIERGMAYLATMQKPEGLWPREPFRRMPADTLVSAFVLFELGDDPAFRAAVRFDEAVGWFEQNDASLDLDSQRLWNHAKPRCHPRPLRAPGAVTWSAADAA